MGKKEDYEALEKQIGDLGGEEQPKGLGKLEHKAAYGQKEDLTNREKEEMEAFMKRQDTARAARENRLSDNEDNNALIADGWVPISRNELGERSIFYPESWQFYIRPATVSFIKNWMSIDDTDLNQVNRVFYEIMKLCVRILDGNTTVSWGNINSWDRFWFILKVRELTFANNKKSISYDDTCECCGEELKFDLNADSLFYEFPDEDLVEKYWDGSVWDIDPTEYDVDHEPITLYTPTLAKEEAILEWARRELQKTKKKELDDSTINFIRFAVWMLNKFSRDEAMFDRQISKLRNEYKNWSIEYYSFMNEVITNLSVNPKETLITKCPHCGEEVVSDVQFPNGVKVLFDVETTNKKFGSR